MSSRGSLRVGGLRSAAVTADGVCLGGGQVGVNATSEEILGHLIRTDTANAFNISVGDVEVTGISQIGRRMLYVNVTATLGVDVPPGASVEDVDTALQVANLSADEPINLLSQNPDRFFGRTTKVGSPSPSRFPIPTHSPPFPGLVPIACHHAVYMRVGLGWGKVEKQERGMRTHIHTHTHTYTHTHTQEMRDGGARARPGGGVRWREAHGARGLRDLKAAD
jgi:hypothetical protein